MLEVQDGGDVGGVRGADGEGHWEGLLGLGGGRVCWWRRGFDEEGMERFRRMGGD